MATDNRKNRRKIGKILADQPGYLKAFVDDPARSTRKLMVVLTRHPYDVARGSFGRGWQSCRTDSYSVKSTGGAEAAAGVLAAYLVRHPEIAGKCSRGKQFGFYTTDAPESFDKAASIFYGTDVQSKHLAL